MALHRRVKEGEALSVYLSGKEVRSYRISWPNADGRAPFRLIDAATGEATEFGPDDADLMPGLRIGPGYRKWYVCFTCQPPLSLYHVKRPKAVAEQEAEP